MKRYLLWGVLLLLAGIARAYPTLPDPKAPPVAQTPASHGYPTLTGSSGQAVIPTGTTGPLGTTLAADWQTLTPDSAAGFPGRILLSFGPNMELGGSYEVYNNHAVIERAWGLNGKLSTGVPFFGGVTAVGAQFRREIAAGLDTDYLQPYLAWTTRFAPDEDGFSNVELTLGGNWTRITDPMSNVSNGFRGFAGVTVNLSDAIDLMAEYQTKNTALGDIDPIIAYTARLHFSQNLAAQVGITNADGFVGTPDQRIFGGLMLYLGGE